MANKRYIIHPHIERVTGITQNEINQELNKFFINVSQDNILFDGQEELNKGILVVNNDVEDPSLYIKDNEGNIAKISGNGSKDVDTYEDALSEATFKNIGQIFYVKEETVLENGTKYSVGPYIVIGEGEMMKLAASSPSGDVDADVAKLKSDVSELNRKVVEIDEKYEQDSVMTTETLNKINTKLASVEEGAQVNAIEKIIVNGIELPITEKTVAMTIEFPEMESEVDGRIKNAYIDEIDGKKYLVLTFTEAANADDILVDVSEMFTEQYSSGKGISLTNSVIALKIGDNEKFLGFDANGGLIFTEEFNNKFIDLEDDIAEIKTDLRDVVATVINNTGELTTLTEVIPQIQTTLNNLSDNVKEQGEEIDGVKNELIDLSQSMQLKDNLFEKEILDINTKFENYTKTGDFTDLQKIVSSNSENIVNLSGITENHTQKIIELTDTTNEHAVNFLEINEDVERIGEVVVELSGGVGTIISDLEKIIILNADNYMSAQQKATKDNIGQIIRISKDSEVEGVTYLRGYYFVEGEGVLSFIMTSDGTQNEIAVINECLAIIQSKLDTIDKYEVNGYAISQKNGVVLEGDDIEIGEWDKISEGQYIIDTVMSGDSINTAVRKLENSLAATVIATTASLNDMNSQINWLVDTTEPVENLLTLKPNVLHVLNTPVSDLVLSFAEGVGEPDNDVAYRYTILFRTAGNIGTISLPTSIRFTDTSLSDLEVDTNYLLEMQYNFAKWRKMKEL